MQAAPNYGRDLIWVGPKRVPRADIINPWYAAMGLASAWSALRCCLHRPEAEVTPHTN
ncbi:hypothetical protein M433DRAFT_141965 [Acidomyces richmondensis BFW]|nr:MAG: hypothetical protein FE78DRAFT_77011 [Acidomyces sp. 'richmondensis']KYG47463.1 hypothetical protein M433DRAFT_141965 [Acidomyces richmondensis BFW]